MFKKKRKKLANFSVLYRNVRMLISILKIRMLMKRFFFYVSIQLKFLK